MIKENAEAKAIGKKVKNLHVRLQMHIQDHKRDYVIGAGGFVSGGFVVAVLRRQPIQIVNNITQVT